MVIPCTTCDGDRLVITDSSYGDYTVAEARPCDKCDTDRNTICVACEEAIATHHDDKGNAVCDPCDEPMTEEAYRENIGTPWPRTIGGVR